MSPNAMALQVKQKWWQASAIKESLAAQTCRSISLALRLAGLRIPGSPF